MAAFITAGFLFGDEGKGRVVDELVTKLGSKLVIRYNGGAQAAHNVIRPNGFHHTFAQFGSGTLAGADTLLSRYMLVNPITLMMELDELAKVMKRDTLLRGLHIDGRALVTTPYHRAINRIREMLRGNGKHGSCGMGIGETMDFDIRCPTGSLRMHDLKDKLRVFDKLMGIRLRYEREVLSPELSPIDFSKHPYSAELRRQLSTFSDESFQQMGERLCAIGSMLNIIDEREVRDRILGTPNPVFEGAQGVLLDETFGFNPYTTWSTTTMTNARMLLNEIGYPIDQIVKLGVIRAYATRHGKGPFVTESQSVSATVPDNFNGHGKWQGAFRSGWLDLAALSYAAHVNGSDNIQWVVTHMDVLKSRKHWQVCFGYEHPDGSEYVPRLGSPTLTEDMLAAVPKYHTVRSEDILAELKFTFPTTPVAFTTHGAVTGSAEKGELDLG